MFQDDFEELNRQFSGESVTVCIAHCKWIHNVLFADDTSICYSANNSDVVTYELGILYLMFRVSHLSLITIKTNVMRFPNNIQPRACVNIVLKGTNIEQV